MRAAAATYQELVPIAGGLGELSGLHGGLPYFVGLGELYYEWNELDRAGEFLAQAMASGATLDFNVSMNTHSVNLGWNLAAQSTLATDTGRQVQGQSWPVGSGHHYAGTLSFPAQTADGASLLEGAKRLTLTISGTDVAQRAFVWDLSQ